MVDSAEKAATQPLEEVKNPRGHNLKGRPKGCKNKTTLVKEAIRGGFDDLMLKSAQKVFEAVVDEAINNRNMTAAKLIMDRVLPTSKAIDLEALEKSQGLSISINVGSLEKQLNPIEAEDVTIIEE